AEAEMENEPNLWPTLIYWKGVEDWRMDQELKFVEFENSLDVLWKQIDWVEKNVSESLSVAQQKTAKKLLQKIARRASAFKYLYGKKDLQVSKYNTDKLTNSLMDNDIHSPELSDPGKATDERGQLYVNVHGLSWRLSEI
ncbi:20250_t:CDS:2, partial [Dentiscutata erythropus]